MTIVGAEQICGLMEGEQEISEIELPDYIREIQLFRRGEQLVIYTVASGYAIFIEL